ncbi:MAG: class II aldolase/adducin family protein [Acidobacteria bacterium]|nr:class II aldolase/adducin family protein [Acidobacteriota bacterium]
MRNELLRKQQIVEIGQWIYTRGFISSTDGNISYREGDEVLVTAKGLCKGRLTTEDIVKTDLQGNQLAGSREPSGEISMHLEVYNNRPDINGVVHAHPVYATAFAVAGLSIKKPILSEVVLSLGCIPLAEYATPTTPELAVALRDYIPHYNAILLANHGALAYGQTLLEAYYRMETLEHTAHIATIARILGKETVISNENLDKLFAVREKYGIKTPDLRALGCPSTTGSDGSNEIYTVSKSELIQLIQSVLEKTK